MMKIFIKPRDTLALALCGAVLPFVAFAGCGGGNGILGNPTPTPVVPLEGTVLPELNFTFNNGQKAKFFSGRVSSTGVVTGQVSVTGAQSLPLQVPSGTYPVTGTLDSAGNFALTQGAGSAYNFGVAGKLPTVSVDGQFTFTAANGATENGAIPRGAIVIPPTNPNPTSNLSGILTYTDKSAGSNFAPTSTDLGEVSQTGGIGPGGVIAPALTVTKSGILTTASDGTQVLTTSFVRTAGGSFTGSTNTIQITLQFPAATGQNLAPGAARTFTKGDSNFSGIIRRVEFSGSDNWELASATIQVNSLSADGKTINYTLSNAKFQPKPRATGDTLNEPGNGTFTAGGTINVATS